MNDRKFAEKFKEGYTVACGLEYAHDVSDKDTYRYSHEFEQRMQALANIIRNRKNRREKLYRIAKVASIFIVSFLLLAGTVKAVSAIVEWCVNKNDISTHISFDVPKGADVPLEIENKYMITRIPEGYELLNEIERSCLISATWVNEKGYYLYFLQSSYSAFNVSLDTEGAIVKSIEINGNKAYSVEKGSAVDITWENGEYVFSLTSTDGSSLDEVIALAESLELVEE